MNIFELVLLFICTAFMLCNHNVTVIASQLAAAGYSEGENSQTVVWSDEVYLNIAIIIYL